MFIVDVMLKQKSTKETVDNTEQILVSDQCFLLFNYAVPNIRGLNSTQNLINLWGPGQLTDQIYSSLSHS